MENDMYSDNEERSEFTDLGLESHEVPDLQSFEEKRASRERLRRSAGSTRNVLEAANDRIKRAFDDFERVLVAFSCGKDSGIVLNLAYDYAKKHNLLHKLAFYYEDYEADYKYTHEYAERTFTRMNDVQRHWLCLPISAACSVSMHQARWIPWNQDEKDLWVRPMPTLDCVVNEFNCPYEFIKGTKGFDARIQYSTWFGKTYGKTAVLIGLRVDESLSRRAIITRDDRTEMHENLKYTKTVDENTCNFYPIYDWDVEDIWVCNAKFGYDYNKIYDLYYQAGLNLAQMRVASPFHASGQENLKLYRVIVPNSWGKMVGRVNGCNFAGIYGGTTAMGWRSITKPKHFTWKQYAEFLLSTLPEDLKKKYEYQIKRFKKQWAESGRGRNQEVIKRMIDEGLEIENTHKVCKRCTKPKLYEVVKIKSDFLDESTSYDFRHLPSWKAIVITIMKNDTAMTYMGLGRTKDQNIMRQQALEKYKKRQESIKTKKPKARKKKNEAV